jgi:hypothetical protein
MVRRRARPRIGPRTDRRCDELPIRSLGGSMRRFSLPGTFRPEPADGSTDPTAAVAELDAAASGRVRRPERALARPRFGAGDIAAPRRLVA